MSVVIKKKKRKRKHSNRSVKQIYYKIAWNYLPNQRQRCHHITLYWGLQNNWFFLFFEFPKIAVWNRNLLRNLDFEVGKGMCSRSPWKALKRKIKVAWLVGIGALHYLRICPLRRQILFSVMRVLHTVLIIPRLALLEIVRMRSRQAVRKACPLKSSQQHRGSERERQITIQNHKATYCNAGSRKQIDDEK